MPSLVKYLTGKLLRLNKNHKNNKGFPPQMFCRIVILYNALTTQASFFHLVPAKKMDKCEEWHSLDV